MNSPYHLKLAAPPLPPLSGPPTHSEEIRTICISGLPGDVKGRELRNLLRWLPGFETSQIDFRGSNPSGFALLFNRQLALAATSTIKGLEFDPEMNSILHAEMAGRNIVLQRDPHASHNPFYLFGCYPVPLGALPTSAVPAPSGDASVRNTEEISPCNTLYIGSLDKNVTEAELRDLFCLQSGYKQMRIIRQELHALCFVEFDDVNHATTAQQNLRGVVRLSSGHGKIKCPFMPWYLIIITIWSGSYGVWRSRKNK